MPVFCECCVLSGRGLRIGLNTRAKLSSKEYGVPECDREALKMREPWPTRGRCRSYPVCKE